MFAKFVTFFHEHRKAFVAAAGAIVGVAATVAPESQYVQAAVAVATIFGVYQVPNRPPAK